MSSEQGDTFRCLLRPHASVLLCMPPTCHAKHPAYSDYVRGRIENLYSDGVLTLNKLKALQSEMRVMITRLHESGAYPSLNSAFK